MASQSLLCLCFVDLYFTRCHCLSLDERFPILFLKRLACHHDYLKPQLNSRSSTKIEHKPCSLDIVVASSDQSARMASVVESTAGVGIVNADTLADAPAGEENLTHTELLATGTLTEFCPKAVRTGGAIAGCDLGFSLRVGRGMERTFTRVASLWNNSIEKVEQLQGPIGVRTYPPPAGAIRLVRELPIAKRSARYEAARPRDVQAFFVQKLGSELRVWGRALSEYFEGTADAELRRVHSAAMVSTIAQDLYCYVLGALWLVELFRLVLEGVPVIAAMPNPPVGNWVNVIFNPGDGVEEVLEACEHHVCFKWKEDLSTPESQTELWLVIQMMFGPKSSNMHAHGFPDAATYLPNSEMVHDRAIDTVAVLNTRAAGLTAAAAALHGNTVVPLVAKRVLPTPSRMCHMINVIAPAREHRG